MMSLESYKLCLVLRNQWNSEENKLFKLCLFTCITSNLKSLSFFSLEANVLRSMLLNIDYKLTNSKDPSLKILVSVQILKWHLLHNRPLMSIIPINLKWCESDNSFNRNLTSNFEFCYFPGLAIGGTILSCDAR